MVLLLRLPGGPSQRVPQLHPSSVTPYGESYKGPLSTTTALLRFHYTETYCKQQFSEPIPSWVFYLEYITFYPFRLSFQLSV